MTDPLGHSTALGYEAYDLRSVTDPLSRTTTTHTDTVGRIALIIDPLGHQTRYEYDQLSQLKKVIDATGKATELTYDQNGNLQSVKVSYSRLPQRCRVASNHTIRRRISRRLDVTRCIA